MIQTLTTERLKYLTFHRSKLIFPASHEEAAAMARELLANREEQPVASREHFESLCNQFWNWAEFDEINTEEEPRLKWDGKKYSHRVTAALWRIYQAAPPAPAVLNGRTAEGWMTESLLQKKIADGLRKSAPAVPESMPEIDRGEGGSDIDYMQPKEIYGMGKTDGWNACRAAMLAAAPEGGK